MVDWNGNGKRDAHDRSTDFYIFNKTSGKNNYSGRSGGSGCLTVFVILLFLLLISGLC